MKKFLAGVIVLAAMPASAGNPGLQLNPSKYNCQPTAGNGDVNYCCATEDVLNSLCPNPVYDPVVTRFQSPSCAQAGNRHVLISCWNGGSGTSPAAANMKSPAHASGQGLGSSGGVLPVFRGQSAQVDGAALNPQSASTLFGYPSYTGQNQNTYYGPNCSPNAPGACFLAKGPDGTPLTQQQMTDIRTNNVQAAEQPSNWNAPSSSPPATAPAPAPGSVAGIPPGSTQNPDGTWTYKDPNDGSKIVYQKNADGTYTVDKGSSLAVNHDYKLSDQMTSTDDCPYSAQINGSYGCSGEKKVASVARAVNTGTQIGGAMVTGVMGQVAQSQAMMAGTQSSVLEGSANLQHTTGMTQMTIGAGNVALGVLQLYDAHRLGQNKKAIASATGKSAQLHADSNGTVRSPNGDTENAISNFNLNDAYGGTGSAAGFFGQSQAYQRLRENGVRQGLQKVGSQAAGEQQSAAGELNQGAAMSLITGATQVTSGVFNIASANQLKKAAQEMAQAQATINNASNGNGNFQADAFAPGQPTVITGSGTNPNPAATGAASAANPPGNFGQFGGPPINPNGAPNGLSGAAPTPGALVPNGQGQQQPGMMGDPMMGATTTAPSQTTQTDPVARAADNREKFFYGSNGGATPARIGGGMASASTDPGLGDIGKVFEKMFGAKGDQASLGQGILQFGRSPAGEPFSPLSPKQDIFAEVANRYQTLQQDRKVGNFER